MHLRIAPLLAALGILAATWAAPGAAAGDDALLTAARTGDLAGTRARLEKGADPNDYVKERSPLQAAAQLGWEEVVDLLLTRGAKKQTFGTGRATRRCTGHRRERSRRSCASCSRLGRPSTPRTTTG